MREPDLVRRAERAATALEQAWMHWRVRHGLGSGSPPPVSSYVGYSLEEPWGQPRVVLGVEAADAERLAAILEGHDCVGPVHAEITGRSDWRQEAAGSVLAWPLPPGDSPSRAVTAGQPVAERALPDDADWAAAALADLRTESADLPVVLRQAAEMADLPPELPGDEAEQLKELAALAAPRPRSGSHDQRPGVALSAASAVEAAAPAETAATANTEAESGPELAAESGPDLAEPMPAAESGPAPEAAEAGDAEGPTEAAATDDMSADSPRGRSRPAPVSKLNRSRKQGAGRGARWPAADTAEQAKSDSSV